jgi:putative transposase
MGLVKALALFLRAFVINRAALAAENLALRQQLSVLAHTVKRPKLRPRDRRFWVWLSRLWHAWRSVLRIVQPDTVIKWHKMGFRLYWRWKSKAKTVGRSPIEKELRDVIRRMAHDNPLWGAPRILSELRLLGYEVSQATVAKYMPTTRKPPSQTWRTFLDNHIRDIAAIDFFVVPTLTFRVLYGLLVLRHDQRVVVHFNATEHPAAQWTTQQIVEAFPFDEAPRFLLRDRDDIFGAHFRQRVRNMGIEEVVIAPRSPWQNPYVERMIGTLRRELLDHVIVRNEAHLCRLVASYLDYYHTVHPHLSLERNAPIPRPMQAPSEGQMVAMPCVGDLHHGYQRVA